MTVSLYAVGSSLQAILGKNHKEIEQVFEYIEQQAASADCMSGLQLAHIPALRDALIHLMKALLDISLLADEIGNHGEKFKKLMNGVAEKAEVRLDPNCPAPADVILCGHCFNISEPSLPHL